MDLCEQSRQDAGFLDRLCCAIASERTQRMGRVFDHADVALVVRRD